MADTSLEAISDTLDELRNSLEEHVEEAKVLVAEAETTGRISRACDSLLARIYDLRRETHHLREMVKQNRDRLNELRSRMRSLLPSQQ